MLVWLRLLAWHLGVFSESRCPRHRVEMAVHGFRFANRRWLCPHGCCYREATL